MQRIFLLKQIRKRLIEMVFEEGVSIYLAAKLLELPYSTAKAIAKKFKT
jgi:transposase